MDNVELAITSGRLLADDYSSLEWSELPPLTEDTLWAIINESISDIQVNQIL